MSVKFVFPVLARHKIINLITFLHNVYQQNEMGDENRPIFDKFSKLLVTTVKIIFLDYANAMIMLTVAIFALNFFNSEYVYLLPFYFPGIPSDTAIGFKLNTAWQFGLSFYSTMAYAFFDGINAFLILHLLLMSNILSNKVHLISEMAAEKQPSELELLRRIKNVILLQNEMRS